MIKNNKFMFMGISSLMFALAFVLAPVFAEAAYTQIGATTLQSGSKGVNVRSLQQFLASDSDMYPSGSQDGMFGRMTKEGVVQFQLAYGLTADGIVGAHTRNTINSVISTGRGIDVSNAGLYNLSIVSSGVNKIISFSNSEPVKSVVFYDTNPINWRNWDDRIMSLNTPEISGLRSIDDSFSINKQFTLNNLLANTRYNYTITTTDQAGNISIVWPNVFNTNQ